MAFIRIHSSLVLNDRFELPSQGLEKVVPQYRKIWQKKEKKIMTGLTKVTGLTFFPNVIDCYIANTQKISNISNPLIIGGVYKPKDFVHILTHELTHILADDNEQNYNWHQVAKKLYPRVSQWVAYHVMTNAVFEALYTDVLHNTDVVIWANANTHLFSKGDDHRRAWEIIDQEGYQSILQKFKAKQFVTSKQFAFTHA